MLDWFGFKITSTFSSKRGFFSAASRRFITITLLSSLILYSVIGTVLRWLLPPELMADDLGAVMPTIIGMLAAIVYIMVIERYCLEKALNRNDGA
ncbi:MAG: hypothetical protein Q4D85_00650 [Corynebacterium sp.]|uniref:hypothetical protein n=1 Tax=Corynebacterium sp. TaxID=1720 RepID=UPI0026DB6860|nr:hypothetical protein [Corynebacterium sp.]MDO5097235.1 hypothetical protein [Corynebacterium sp.]